MRVQRQRLTVVIVLLVIALAGVACGGSNANDNANATNTTTPQSAATASTGSAESSAPSKASSDVTLTLYNAQHEELINAMVAGFTEETGIKVDVRSGKDFDMANQIVAEGDSSPADVFITENSPAMQVVESAGLFAPVDAGTLAHVPTAFAPSNGNWVGVAARATVLIYNTDMLSESELPTSIMDLSAPAWKGKFGVAAGGADFQAIVSAVVAVEGRDAAATWLAGVKTNAKIYQGNGATMRAVNAGEIAAGVIYHYYWFGDQAESGENSSNTQLHYFQNHDAGGFVGVSGIGALKSSKHPVEAQMLLEYMTGEAGQQILADSDAFEYPVNSNVPAHAKLKPLSELSMPTIDIGTLNGPEIVALMIEAGLL
jgi:iron(III) transport system substrate-binding protein